MPRCPTIPTAKFPTQPGRPWTSNCGKRKLNWMRQAQAQLDRLEAEYGVEAFANLEQQRRTMRGFKIAQGKLGQRICSAWQRVEQLEKRRAAVPRRVPVGSLTEEPVVKLAPERKHLTNVI